MMAARLAQESVAWTTDWNARIAAKRHKRRINKTTFALQSVRVAHFCEDSTTDGTDGTDGTDFF